MAVSYLQSRRTFRTDMPAGALGPGTVEREVAGKLREQPHLFDFISDTSHATINAGTNSNDHSVALQAFVDAGGGNLPKGRVLFGTRLDILSRGVRLCGHYPERRGSTPFSTDLSFTGSGCAIRVGTADASDWDASLYNGPQGLTMERVGLRYLIEARDTTIFPGQSFAYRAGTTGIEEWRAGSVCIRDCNIEFFETGMWLINSDFDRFDNLLFNQCGLGLYIGPRSDQFLGTSCQFTLCRRGLEIDGARSVRFQSPHFISCGNATNPAVSVRRGTAAVTFDGAWCEHFQGYQGTDTAAFFWLGVELGYGAQSGGLPTYTETAACSNIAINNPFSYSANQGAAAAVLYFASIGAAAACIDQPAPPPGIGHNLSKFLEFTTGVAHSPSTGQVRWAANGSSVADLYVNNGTGTPNLHWEVADAVAVRHGAATANARLYIDSPNSAALARSMYIGMDGLPNTIVINNPDSTTQTNRLYLRRAFQTASAMPSSGTYQAGDMIFNDTPVAAANNYRLIGWYRLTTGSNHVAGTDWELMYVRNTTA